jgi:hypothetical protein
MAYFQKTENYKRILRMYEYIRYVIVVGLRFLFEFLRHFGKGMMMMMMMND